MTLYEFGLEIQKIREAVNSLTVKGAENASLVVYAAGKCNDLIKEINGIMENQRSCENGQNGEELDEEGGIDGQPDRGTASPD